MKLKNIDGELYIDREVKVFFRDDIIPEKYKDKTKWDLVIIDSDRPKRDKENGENKNDKTRI